VGYVDGLVVGATVQACDAWTMDSPALIMERLASGRCLFAERSSVSEDPSQRLSSNAPTPPGKYLGCELLLARDTSRSRGPPAPQPPIKAICQRLGLWSKSEWATSSTDPG
jgi:hypothetical protein